MATNQRDYQIALIYDTETTNLQIDGEWFAYPHLYIVNDVMDVPMDEYRPGHRLEQIHLYRSEDDFHTKLGEVIEWGLDHDVVPIVAAYNLMFDLTPHMAWLVDNFEVSVNAQSSAKVYTMDLALMDNPDVPVLRFWDTYNLELNGLAAMGRTCGFAKAVGDWDYDLVRTPETPLTEAEIGYAKRDVQVIPAYLRYLLDANPWMEPGDLGVRIVTKTSNVRQLGKNEIGPIESTLVPEGKDQPLTLSQLFLSTCRREKERQFEQFSVRRACFRGGFTFTAANYAGLVQTHCTKVDVTSMHHTFINGRRIPFRFAWADSDRLQIAVDSVLRTPRKRVLQNYVQPFYHGLHVLVRLERPRVKEGTGFERWGIACLPQAKFGSRAAEDYDSDLNKDAEQVVKDCGFKDRALNPVFAFSKLMNADIAWVWVSELELWCIGQVYDFDSCTAMVGELSQSFCTPPEYVMLQSHLLYGRKNEMKHIVNSYQEGVPLAVESDTLPPSIVESVNRGTATKAFLESYYQSTVKGLFNSIYGCMAQCIYKPQYRVMMSGRLEVDPKTRPTPENWDAIQPKSTKVLYTYGLRIVGGSRMHMVIALQLIWDAFGDQVTVTGGDTDSMIVARGDSDIAPEDVARALAPLLDASRRGIAGCSKNLRQVAPTMASDLDGVGGFDIEEADIPEHVDLWNKCRVSRMADGTVHLTMAGISRPPGAYTVETLIEDEMAKGMTFEAAVNLCIGPSVTVTAPLAHSLERTTPDPRERFHGEVTDYLGRTALVDAPLSPALYPASREICAIDQGANIFNIIYLESIGRPQDLRERVLCKGCVKVLDYDGEWKEL